MVGDKFWLMAGLALKAIVKGALSLSLWSIFGSNIRKNLVKNGVKSLAIRSEQNLLKWPKYSSKNSTKAENGHWVQSEPQYTKKFHPSPKSMECTCDRICIEGSSPLGPCRPQKCGVWRSWLYTLTLDSPKKFPKVTHVKGYFRHMSLIVI